MARIGCAVASLVLLAWPLASAAAPEPEPLVFKLLPPAGEGAGALQPVVFRLPSGYAPAQEAMRRTDGVSLSILAMYPSYAPFVAGPGRCGAIMCGDEVGAKVELATAAPPGRTGEGSLRSEMEAKTPAGSTDTTFSDAAVPDGFSEAFTVEKAALPGRAYTHSHLEYLVYRDNGGVQRVGSCGVEGAHPSCTFKSYDPVTHLAMTFTLPRANLGERDAIEAGLQALFARWRVPAP